MGDFLCIWNWKTANPRFWHSATMMPRCRIFGSFTLWTSTDWNVNCPNLYGQHKKEPLCRKYWVFKRSGTALAVPLPFLFGYVHSCKSRCSHQLCVVQQKVYSVCTGKCTLFLGWRRNFLPLHCHKDFLPFLIFCKRKHLAYWNENC